MSWAEWAAAGGKDAVIRGLDIRAVAAVGGVSFDTADGLACCPFHPETTGSFNVFTGDDGKQRFCCHGCGVKGDVIDFLQKRYGLSYGGAIERGEELLAEGLPAPTRAISAVGAPVDLMALLAANWNNPLATVEDFCASRNTPYGAGWLAAEFNLAVNGRGEILIPHFGPGGTLGAVKRRSPDGSKAAYSGSRLTELYGSWRLREQARILLCEGESDTWHMAWLLREREDFCVLGLPRGVGAMPEPAWLGTLAGREVTLLFDADDAGRAGLVRWVAALPGCSVAVLPEGTDASSCPEREMQILIKQILFTEKESK